MDASLVDLLRDEYALAIMMLAKKDILAIGWNNTCVGIIAQSTSACVWTSMPCPY
jgi:hypothetical protein